MTRKAWLLGGGGALIVSVVAIAFLKNKPPPVDSGVPQLATISKEDAERVLVKIGDRTITLGDYAATLEHLDQFERLRYQSPERRKELLKEMINIELLAQEAREKGLDKDPIVQEEQRAILREAMLTEARKRAPRPEDVPIEEARAYFDAHKPDYKDPERRRISLIVLRSESEAKGALDAAKSTKTAAEWGEIVRKRSIDPQAKAAVPVDLVGDFGFVAPPGDPRGENLRVPEDVRKGAFEIGSVGEILPRFVKVGDLFYLVRLSGKNEPRERGFPEAERMIRAKLAQDKMREKEQEFIAELKKDVKIEIDDGVLQSIRVELGSVKSDAGADKAAP